MSNSTLLYVYKAEERKLYIHYPKLTASVPVEDGIDGKYVVFEDDYALNEFLGYLDDNNLDTSELNTFAFGETWDAKALALSELF